MRGATYPLQTGADGLIEISDDTSVLMQSALKQYLLSTRGARVMRPTWGASTSDLLFDPLDDVTMQLFRVAAKEAELHLAIIVDDVEFIDTPGRVDKLTPIVYFHVVGDEATDQQIDFANPTTAESGGTA